MADMIYSKMSGYLYDLIFSFLLYYNREETLEQYGKGGVTDTEKQQFRTYVDEMMKRFPEASPHLILFFYWKDLGVVPLAGCYLDNEEMLHDGSVDKLLKRLADADELRRNMLTFYFGGKGTALEKNMPELVKEIDKLEVPEQLKHHLLAFCVSPESYARLLIDEIKTHEVVLRQLYIEREDEIRKTAADCTLEELNKLSGDDEVGMVGGYEEIPVSFCLLAKGAVVWHSRPPIYVVGIDYRQTLQNALNIQLKPNILEMGKALADANRIRILNMLREEKEISTPEMVRRLELSMTATYYHLEMLVSVHALNCRNEGRTIFYSLNRDYFRYALLTIKDYSE